MERNAWRKSSRSGSNGQCVEVRTGAFRSTSATPRRPTPGCSASARRLGRVRRQHQGGHLPPMSGGHGIDGCSEARFTPQLGLMLAS